MSLENQIPELLRQLLKNPNRKVGQIERLIIELELSADVITFIHRQLASSLLPPQKQ